MIIGTAGHIDHGKTVLIKALTGANTDRLKEEKKRGISIELGFAEFKLPSGRTAGVVDVPGHEAFIKNMLAGATGFDLVLLVIAADDSVMPQTREHLAIISLLGVKRGVVAITKSDLVEEEMIDLVEEEARELLKNTALKNIPMVSVSAVTGKGIDELLEAIDKASADVIDREQKGNWRLPIDRVFTLKGVGTVVTGSLWSGLIKENSSAVLLPAEKDVRVRSVQVHEKSIPEALAGNRVAVNIPGVERHEIHRGDVLASRGFLGPTYMIDADLNLLLTAKHPLKNWTRIRVHHGTTEVMARIVLLDRDVLEPGKHALVQLRLEKPMVVLGGDRFIIRSYSPIVTIGGGEVLESHPKRRRRFDEQTLSLLTAIGKQDFVKAVKLFMDEVYWPSTIDELVATSEFTRSNVEGTLDVLTVSEHVVDLKMGATFLFMSKDRYDKLREKVVGIIGEHHEKFPLERGLGKGILRNQGFANCPSKKVDVILKNLEAGGFIKIEQNLVMLPEKATEMGRETFDMLVEQAFHEAKFKPPAIRDFVGRLDLNERDIKTIIARLKKQGKLIEVTLGMYFHAESISGLEDQVVFFLTEKGKMAPADFKEIAETTRKFAIPLLEYLDRKGVTKREGDYRILA